MCISNKIKMILNWSLAFFILIILFPVNLTCQTKYEEGDWVSYSDFHQINDIAVGRRKIYIATDGGVLRYDRYKNKWLAPWVVVRGFQYSTDLRYALNVDYLPENDEVAVLTNHGAYYYNPVAKYWKPTSCGFSPAIITDGVDAAFISPPDFLFSRKSYFTHGNDVIMDSNLKKYSYGVTADDEWGGTWVGIDGIGMLQMDRHSKRGTVWELGLTGLDVRSIARGKGWTIFAGHNRDGGITFWKRVKNVWDHIDREYTTGLESAWINDLTVSGKWLLAATDYGLAQIDLKNGDCRHWTIREGLWSNETTCVAVDKDTAWVKALHLQPIYKIAVDRKAVWIGGELGLFKLDKKTATGEWIGFDGGIGGPVYALHSTADELWVGGLYGVEVISKDDMEQTGYPAQAHFGGAEVNAVYAEGLLVWVGTNRGLWKFDRKRNYWHQYTRNDGLIDDNVLSIYPDGNYLLLGTEYGVTRFYWNDPDRVD